MTKIIKSKPIDEKLAKAIAKLSVANSMLSDSLKADSVIVIRTAILSVRAAMEEFSKTSKTVGESLENSASIVHGIALMCESDILCNKGANKIRKFFRIVKGGKDEKTNRSKA